MTAAFVALALYLVLYVPGVFANLIFWRRVRRDQRLTGQAPEGKGCLTAMLILFIGLPLLAGLALLLLIAHAGPDYRVCWTPVEEGKKIASARGRPATRDSSRRGRWP